MTTLFSCGLLCNARQPAGPVRHSIRNDCPYVTVNRVGVDGLNPVAARLLLEARLDSEGVHQPRLAEDPGPTSRQSSLLELLPGGRRVLDWERSHL